MTVQSPDLHVAHVKRILTDTGYCARHLLGYNYDENPGVVGERFNEGQGGVRAYGPHQQMVEFVDSPSQWKLLQAPRKSLKSTICAAWVIRHLLRNPMLRVFYAMRTLKEAQKKIGAIQKHFTNNQTLIKYFGNLKGDPWQDSYMNLKGRAEEPGNPEYTIQAGGVDVAITGSRFDVGVLDDLVDWDNIRNADQIEKVIDYVKSIIPLRAAGSILLIIGTAHHGADLYAFLKEHLSKQFEILILDCGFEPVEVEGGLITLEGTARYELPALQKDKLLEELRMMQYEKFCAQYLNRIVSGASQPFRREHFQPVRVDSTLLSALSGYILTDTAYSEKDESCYSVVALCGFDAADNCYLLDLRVGHWTPSRFIDEFFMVHTRWMGQLTIHGWVFELIGLNAGMKPAIEERARTLRLRPNILEVSVGRSDQAKDERILGLQPRFQDKRFYVASTVPRTFIDVSETKVLWNPEGVDEGGMPAPDGELVKEFIMHRRYPKKDIADALANMERLKADGTRVCRFVPSRHRVRPQRDMVPGSVFVRRSYQEPGNENSWESKLVLRKSPLGL